MDESALIAQLFAPLAKGAAGAFSLTDDAAQLPIENPNVTNAALIAGVHFRKEDPLDLVAMKALRVNLSDIAAMGARPVGYVLACAWPRATSAQDIAQFARGLSEDQRRYDIALYGGDTTAHADERAPLVGSVTMFGDAPREGVVRRDGARPGDDLYVTGVIGYAGLGLAALDRRMDFDLDAAVPAVDRYLAPRPRLAMGRALARIASAMLDVSDGLLKDAGRLAAASAVDVEIDAGAIQVSPLAAAWLARESDPWRARAQLAAFGDDYELLFAASPARRAAVEAAAAASETPVARIGRVRERRNLDVSLTLFLDPDGRAIEGPSSGYDHFAR
ncbi:MAG: thiamine-phosphate kinase [Parvularculaceae bacterium]